MGRVKYFDRMKNSTPTPLYVEITPLLFTPLTGIGRFVARLVEALSVQGPLSLVTFRPVSPFLAPGETIEIEEPLPTCDSDLESWVSALLARPHGQHRVELSRESACLFTHLRPATRHFRCEIAIVYDFTPLLVPWAHASETRDLFGCFFGERLPLCDAVVAISQATRRDALWLSQCAPEKVVVGYPGASLCVYQHASRSQQARHEKMILVVSTIEPRKNAQFLLDWFLSTNVLPDGFRLCWAGPRVAWKLEGQTQEPWKRLDSDETSLKREVEFLGFVPDAQLCELYQQATFTIYPSLYEGFGFPVLDSLRHGAPVLCGYHSSLQEFEGPGVFYFDPCDMASLDAACRGLLNASTVTRSVPAQEALDARFSWSQLAGSINELCRIENAESAHAI
jgi:glycosyltransferase involved in cell wall biosynthesis